MPKDENVIKMPAPLERLATRIKADIVKRDEGREQWITATLDMCEALAEAREHFRDDNNAFGRWCDDNDILPGIDNRDERAAAVAIGSHLDIAREVLSKTTRTSLRLIRKEELAPRLSQRCDNPPKVVKRRPNRLPIEKEQTVEGLIKQGLPEAKIREQTGVSGGTIQSARRAIEAREEERAKIEQEALDREAEAVVIAASQPKQAKFNEACERLTKRLVGDFEQRAKVELEARWQERERLQKERHERELKEANDIRANHRGVFFKSQLALILRCLHPDTALHVSAEQRNEAFQAVNDKRHLLERPDAQADGPDDDLAAIFEARAKAAAEKRAKAAARKAEKGATQ